MRGKVVRIFVAAAAGDPMQEVMKAEAVAGKGLVGDRYAEEAGTFSRTRAGTPRDLTLISLEAVQAANGELRVPFLLAETRRNVVVSGVPDLNSLVGAVFLLGEVLVQGAELCAPCKRPSDLAGKEGFRDAFAGRGGLRARILKGGRIHLGDLVTFPEEPGSE